MDNRAKINIKNLNFYYHDHQAIKDVSLDIKYNEIYAIFGPANSGTTTILKAINRMCDLIPGTRTEGEILLDGKDIRSPDFNITELRRRVGIVFEEPVPLPMSIFDNIAYGPRMSGIKNKVVLAERVENSLRMAVLWDEVKDKLHSPALRLSGGQQQRLCIARILALEPEVIMLDRPCAALDPISTFQIEESLKLLKERFTIIIVPHNIQQAARVADRAGFMLMGTLVEEGDTDQMFVNPREQKTSDYITGRFG